MTAATAQSSTAPTVAVTGHGRREVRPDQVEFHFCIEGIHPTVAQAEQGLQHRRSALLDALASHRATDARITADGPIIAPYHEYENHARVFKGFKAAEHVILRAPLKPGFANAILHAVSAQLKNITLTVRHRSKKTSAALRSARAEAVRDARRKAAHFAEASGHQLGRLLRLSDTPPKPGHSAHDEYDTQLFSAAHAAPVEIDAESQAVTAEVHAVWELHPA